MVSGRSLGSGDEWTDFLAGLAATTVLAAVVTVGLLASRVGSGSASPDLIHAVTATMGAVAVTAAYAHRRRNN